MDSNSLEHIAGYIDAMFNDMEPLYSTSKELMRDKTRLVSEYRVRGLRLFTMDLPAVSKAFDKALDDGFLPTLNLVLTRRGAHQYPLFLKDLMRRIFSSDGYVLERPCPYCVKAVRQVFLGLNKLKKMCHEEFTIAETKEFDSIDRELPPPTYQWWEDGTGFLLTGSSSCVQPDFRDRRTQLPLLHFAGEDVGDDISLQLYGILSQVCDRISAQLGDFHVEHERELPGHGPGRVSNLRKEESKYHFDFFPRRVDHTFPTERYTKSNGSFEPQRSGVSSDVGQVTLFPAFPEGGNNFPPSQRNRNTACRPDMGDQPLLAVGVHPGDDALGNGTNPPRSGREFPSKLIAVPKTMKKPRLIASEPHFLMYLQQLLKQQLESRMNSTPLRECVRFRDQGRNQRFALEASASGKYATVDLSSASDRLSLWTVERVFRKNHTFLERLNATRSRVIANSISPSIWKYRVLNKAFSQGNACTFPTQSVVYACFAIAAVLFSRKLKVNRTNIEAVCQDISVYGDDIIVPIDAVEPLFDILDLNYLKVNLSKTFFKGKFRESCGCDAYDGVDVTPAYIKSIDKDPQSESYVSAVQASNNLHVAGYWNLAEWQRPKRSIPVGEIGSHPLVLHSFVGSKTSSTLKWDKDHQHWKIRAPVVKVRLQEHPEEGTEALLKCFIEHRFTPTFDEQIQKLLQWKDELASLNGELNFPSGSTVTVVTGYLSTRSLSTLDKSRAFNQ